MFGSREEGRGVDYFTGLLRETDKKEFSFRGVESKIVRRHPQPQPVVVDCLQQCTEVSYYVHTVGSPWPHLSNQLAFYQKYIAPHPQIYVNNFDVYGELVKQAIDTNNSAQILTRIASIDLMRRYFVRVEVLLKFLHELRVQ